MVLVAWSLYRMANVNSLTGVRWTFNFKEWRPTANEWMMAVRCVQKEEMDRIRRFVYQNDVKSGIVGRLLMRKAANEITSIPYEKIQFSRSQYGKPYISNYTDFSTEMNFSFNISHHGNFCVIAAEPFCCDLGVDVMEIQYKGYRTLSDYFNLMKKQFAFSEFEFLTSPSTEKEQLERFYRLWCLKESYVKALGIGISRSLKDIEFHCQTLALSQNSSITDTKLSVDGKLATEWKFQEMLIDSSHCVATAFRQNSRNFQERTSPCQFVEISFERLMENAVPFAVSDGSDWLEFQNKLDKPS